MRQLAKAAATFVLSATGIASIVTYEGSEPVVYLDPVGIPTVCSGHTRTVTRADVGQSRAHLCAQLLYEDARHAQDVVRAKVKVPITQQQFDALVSFVFNVGEQAFTTSALLRKLNDGQCFQAGAEFDRWVLAKGRRLPGLVARRASERLMFETGCR